MNSILDRKQEADFCITEHEGLLRTDGNYASNVYSAVYLGKNVNANAVRRHGARPVGDI